MVEHFAFIYRNLIDVVVIDMISNENKLIEIYLPHGKHNDF